MVGGRRDGRRRDGRGDLPVGAAPGRCLDAGRPRRDRGRLGLGRLRRGRRLRARPVGGRVRRPGAGALRRLRRRRLRRRPDLRRDPRRVRREGRPRDLPRARRDRRRRRGRPSRSPRLGHRAPRPRPARSPPRDPPRRPGVGHARVGADGRRRTRRHPRAARGRPQRDADLRSGRRAPGRGDAGVRVGVRAQAADAGLRGDRLRGGGGARRQLPRLPRHRLRRPPGLRHHQPLPRGRRGGRRLAAPLSRGPRSRPGASTSGRCWRC